MAGCGSTKFVPRTEVVVLKTDEALLAKVAVPQVAIVVNEDFDRKTLRLEAALKECNARLDDVKAAQDAALEEAKTIAAKSNQPALSWWQRMTGGRP